MTYFQGFLCYENQFSPDNGLLFFLQFCFYYLIRVLSLRPLKKIELILTLGYESKNQDKTPFLRSQFGR